MSSTTSIQWCDRTWSPIIGCTSVSAGCSNCYAERFVHRGLTAAHRGLTRKTPSGPKWTGEVRTLPERLGDPLKRRKPARIFVNSMSDLFHEAVADDFIQLVFAVMAAASRHTFIVLTKRPERAREWFRTVAEEAQGWAGSSAVATMLWHRARLNDVALPDLTYEPVTIPWPLPNVILGVSVEDQRTADERIPLLLDTPAAVRAVSYEPALGPVDFRPWLRPRLPRDEPNWRRAVQTPAGPRDGLDWLIVGGESGHGARPFDVAWARRAVEQARAAGCAAFVKQMGANVRDRNDAGFEAQNDVWADGPDAGLPTVPTSWPTPLDLEHDLDGSRDGYQGAPVRVRLHDRSGGEPSEWPLDLRVRDFPDLNPVASA